MFEFIKGIPLFNKDKNTEMDADFNQKNKNGDNNIEHVNVAKNQIINNIGEISDLESLENLKEFNISHDTKVKFIELDDALVEGKTRHALNGYIAMRKYERFQNFPKKFKVKVLLGILNAKINLNINEEQIQESINDIRAVGEECGGIHRLYYLQAIIEYKKKEFENALNFVYKSLEIDSTYMKAKALKTVIKHLLNQIDLSQAEKTINNLVKESKGNIKDKESLFGALGDVFFNAQKYHNARKHYKKASEFRKTLSKDIAIGVCIYYEAFLVKDYSEIIPLEKINFTVLDKSKKKFEEIVAKINNDNLKFISELMFPYYFGILILFSEHDKIAEIYNQYKENLELKNENVIGFIVESQIKNKELDEQLLEKLSNQLFFSYKSLYHEVKGEFQEAIEILEQGIAQFPEDKRLQLALLNSLKNNNNKDKYLYYYKKFNPNETDDGLIMNYIIFLKDNNKDSEMIKKSKALLDKTNNPTVLDNLFELFLRHNKIDLLMKIYYKIRKNKANFVMKKFDKIQYQLMMYFLEHKLHSQYLKEYPKLSFKYLENEKQLLIDLNYFIIEGKYKKASEKYYKLFTITNNYEYLLRLVELLFKSNSYHEVEFYLEQINPMELAEPEMFYICYARYYELIEDIDKGFKKLDEIKDSAFKNKDSSYHKFYFGYCLRNHRFGQAFRYYSEYKEINPEVDWVDEIHHGENEGIDELVNKINKISGGEQNFNKIDRMLNQRLVGVSVYSIITNRDLEYMFFNKNYPFNKLNISISGIKEDLKKYEISDSLIVDADTLYLLYRIDVFEILELFDNVYIPQETFGKMRNNNAINQNRYMKELIHKLEKDIRFKALGVSKANEDYEKYKEMYEENISQCLIMSDIKSIPFLSSEITLKMYFEDKKIIDINNLVAHLRTKDIEEEKISDWIYRIKKHKLEFISFKACDIYNSFNKYGNSGIEPHLRMSSISNYSSFIEVYISFLLKVGQELGVDKFNEIAGIVIKYLDKYTGKTRYYLSEIKRINSNNVSQYSRIIDNKINEIFIKFSVKNIYDLITILNKSDIFRRNVSTKKLEKIVSAYIYFINEFVKLSIFLNYTELELIEIIYNNIKLNNKETIDYFIY